MLAFQIEFCEYQRIRPLDRDFRRIRSLDGFLEAELEGDVVVCLGKTWIVIAGADADGLQHRIFDIESNPFAFGCICHRRACVACLVGDTDAEICITWASWAPCTGNRIRIHHSLNLPACVVVIQTGEDQACQTADADVHKIRSLDGFIGGETQRDVISGTAPAHIVIVGSDADLRKYRPLKIHCDSSALGERAPGGLVACGISNIDLEFDLLWNPSDFADHIVFVFSYIQIAQVIKGHSMWLVEGSWSNISIYTSWW